MGVLPAGRTPIDEQVPLQPVSMYCRWGPGRSYSVYYRPPRTSASHPGTTRGDSTSLDAGARGCSLSEKGDPSSEEFAKEGLSQRASVLVTKSDWASKALPKKTCSSSSLTLHRVCARMLTGGDAYLRRPRGQLCASASVPSVPSDRE